MNVLLVYPQFPCTFWSFKHALKFVRKRASHPPLGLLTVAAMLPEEWNKRLVDMNVDRLGDGDLAWADLVFLSGMTVQREPAREVIARCRGAGVRVVAGGPLFTTEHENFEGVDHFVLDEAELTLPRFLADLARGAPDHVYRAHGFADVGSTPAPLWTLARHERYATMSVQYSRGCPFDCEFCNVTSLLGRKVRTKSVDKVIFELDDLWRLGWRGGVFFVDDNFIGVRKKLKTELLPALIRWRSDKPSIAFSTEASIDLADDDELMGMMVQAGFDTVFIGIETPDEASLRECGKAQNQMRDLVADVRKIHRAGIQVQGGFIVGFDHESPSIFERQIAMIQQSGIVTAMVGMLQALPGTKLFERMAREGRLVGKTTGDNVDGTTNIVPRTSLAALQEGYQRVLRHVYSPRQYYERVRTFLRDYSPPPIPSALSFGRVMAFFRSIPRLGILGRERFEYWRLLLWTIARRRKHFALAVTLAIYGHHFRKVCEQQIAYARPRR